MLNELIIEGVKYVPESTKIANSEKMQFVIVRGYGSGVNFGYLKKCEGSIVELQSSRRIWAWEGASDVNQISLEGINEKKSKVTKEVEEKTICDAIEILPCTEAAYKNLTNQPIWSF